MQCEKSSIRVNIDFDRPFFGLVFSKGHYSDPNCVHLQSGSGATSTVFEIQLNQCGMTSSGGFQSDNGQPNPAGSYIESTIIVQYDPLVQEVWDQARKLRCTWYDYYEKSVTFRPFQVNMLNAVTANFLGDNLQCWMQIQSGKGPWSSEVSGIVKIGQTMTMVLGIKDEENKFDMVVSFILQPRSQNEKKGIRREYLNGCTASAHTCLASHYSLLGCVRNRLIPVDSRLNAESSMYKVKF